MERKRSSAQQLLATRKGAPGAVARRTAVTARMAEALAAAGAAFSTTLWLEGSTKCRRLLVAEDVRPDCGGCNQLQAAAAILYDGDGFQAGNQGAWRWLPVIASL